MYGQDGSVILFVLFLCTPIAIIPLIIGVYILRREPYDRLSQFAGLLTLKPLLATPIWAILVSSALSPSATGSILITLIPGAGLTLLLLYDYHPLLREFSTRSAAWKLLALDCFRWLSSFGLVLQSATSRYTPTASNLVCLSTIVAIAMPTVFSLAALWLSSGSWEKRKNDWDEKPKNDFL